MRLSSQRVALLLTPQTIYTCSRYGGALFFVYKILYRILENVGDTILFISRSHIGLCHDGHVRPQYLDLVNAGACLTFKYGRAIVLISLDPANHQP